MSAQPSGPALILVFGMHRSGTSALTRAIALGGARLPRTLLEARVDNEGGYWESARFVAIDEAILRSLDTHALGAWTRKIDGRYASLQPSIVAQLARVYGREFPRDAATVVKDPRMCLLARAHLVAARSTHRPVVAVLLVRDPDASARSLATRNGLSLSYAQLLWRQHVLMSEFETRATPRLIVRHDELMNDPVSVVERVCALAGLARPSASDQIRNWIDPRRAQPARRANDSDPLSRAIFDELTAEPARLDAWRNDAIAAGESVDPGCPTAWLLSQSDVTIGWAQVAALAAEFADCAGKPDEIDRALRTLDLRLGALDSTVQPQPQLIRGST